MENIYTTAQPFYVLTKGLGLFPMSNEGSAFKPKFRVRLHDIVASFLAFLVPILLIVLNSSCSDAPASSSRMLSDIWRVHAIFGVFLVVLNFIYQIRRRSEILKFLEMINEFDKKVSTTTPEHFETTLKSFPDIYLYIYLYFRFKC